jgi:hypothetical protein
LMRFWWSWWGLNPRPIVNSLDDYRLISFEFLKRVYRNDQKRTG